MTRLGRVLIDSSAWIACLDRPGHEGVRRAVTSSLESDNATTTGMVVLEVLRGARTPAAFAQLEAGFSLAGRLRVDEFTWHEAARLGWELRRNGLNVQSADLLIAAVAIVHDCTLLHHDRHFEMIAEHAPLKTWSPAA